MKIFLFSFFFFISLYAKNPVVFKEFGDPLYENASKFEKLKDLLISDKERKEIEFYLQELKKVKEFGNTLSLNDQKTKEKYFQLLRELALSNDTFVEKAREIFRDSLKKSDLKTFFRVLETGLIDIQRNEVKIFQFYSKHKKEFLPQDVYIDDIKKYEELFKNIEKNEKNRLEEVRIKDLQDQIQMQKKLEAAIEELSKE